MAIQTLNDLEDPQTIPVLLLDGTLQYPSISADTTTQDLVETLIRLDEVKCTVFDVAPSAWALQRVHKENPGRSWDETELAALDDGKLSVDTRLHADVYVHRNGVTQTSSNRHRSSPHS